MPRKLCLGNGSRVAIIGGGPAGAFFAHFIQKYARERNITIKTVIFDGKDFLQKGPKGCNLCAGVIAESLHQKLNEEGIFLPDKRIINRIDGYSVHIGQETLVLKGENGKKSSIVTVFRGNGPRYSDFPVTVSFDDFLLSFAQDQGAEVVSLPVWEITVPNNKYDPLTLSYRDGKIQKYFEADLIVGAFGVNTHLMKVIEELGFGYRPPNTLTTFQAELMLGKDWIDKHFGNSIHVYFSKLKSIRFATVIPKGDYITITLIGRKNISKNAFHEFLRFREFQDTIPSGNPHCLCYPKITISPSKKPFSDRIVVIGDAAFSRHYKNGLESAFITAELAARASIFKGIDKTSLYQNYYLPAKKTIIRDNSYGRALFAINDCISSIPFLARYHIALAEKKDKKSSSKLIRKILWNMFTGNISYKEIFKMTLNLRLQGSLIAITITLIIKKLARLFTIKKN